MKQNEALEVSDKKMVILCYYLKNTDFYHHGREKIKNL